MKTRGFSPAREFSQILHRFSPGYEGTENMFYFLNEILHGLTIVFYITFHRGKRFSCFFQTQLITQNLFVTNNQSKQEAKQ